MTISILGCGWLGLPLARHLIACNHHIKGSTTTPQKISRLEADGIEPYLINLNPELEANDDLHSFWEAASLVINIPPGRGRDNIIKLHTKQIQSIIRKLEKSPVRQVVFVSSTSVYPKHPGLVSERQVKRGEAGRSSGNALLEVEKLLMENANFETTIVRFGGLIGGDRHPAKYMAGRKKIRNGEAPVNLIHREDCIQIINQIIEKGITGETFNAVTNEHPTRRAYYTRAAKKLNLELPEFMPASEKKHDYKIVSNQKIKERLNYTFIYPQPWLPE